MSLQYSGIEDQAARSRVYEQLAPSVLAIHMVHLSQRPNDYVELGAATPTHQTIDEIEMSYIDYQNIVSYQL